jgi:predicted acyl esterase
VLPKGWQREPGFRPLPCDVIWEKDVEVPLRDGTVIRADIFRPAELDGTPVPTILPWSPYGKTDTGM